MAIRGFRINMGQPVTDVVTGFHGIVTGRLENRDGTLEYYVAPKVVDNKLGKPEWIGEDRLVANDGESFGFSKEEKKP